MTDRKQKKGFKHPSLFFFKKEPELQQMDDASGGLWIKQEKNDGEEALEGSNPFQSVTTE